MAYEQWHGQKDKTHSLGQIEYVGDGTNFFPVLGSTAGIATSARPIISQREPFIFRPGAQALSSTSTITGMVLSGVRTSGASTVTANSATTYWSPTVTYNPLRGGKIDGLAASGIVSGQITMGLLVTTAATADAKLTARIRNNGGTWTTCLFLSATVIAVGGTTEVFKTYDIPYLYTTADFNAVPLDFAIGVQSDKAAASAIITARIMESSYIQGEFEPGT